MPVVPEPISIPSATRLDQVDANTLYIGKADPGSVEGAGIWQIQRLTVFGSITSVLWADGDTEFDNIWANRAGLDYS